MVTSSKFFYGLLVIMLSVGLSWIGHQVTSAATHSNELTICTFKNVTGLPCPGCGTTRSISLVVDGNVGKSIHTNPLGILSLLLMAVLIPWLAYDALKKKSTLHNFYLRLDNQLKQPQILIPIAAIIVANWAWNIVKDL